MVKAGDLVRILNSCGESDKVNVGSIMEVLCIDSNENIFVLRGEKGWACECKEGGHFWRLSEKSYELVKNNKSLMSKIGKMFKKLVDSNTRTLREADYIDGELDLTEEGKEALIGIIFDLHKEDLVKDAQEKIDEEKKNEEK